MREVIHLVSAGGIRYLLDLCSTAVKPSLGLQILGVQTKRGKDGLEQNETQSGDITHLFLFKKNLIYFIF